MRIFAVRILSNVHHPAPDIQCNMPCNANTSELWVAGNRLAVYQDSGATPISPDTCLTGLGFFNFDLQAIPMNPAGGALAGGVTRQIYAVTLNFNFATTAEYTILSVCLPQVMVLFEFLAFFHEAQRLMRFS